LFTICTREAGPDRVPEVSTERNVAMTSEATDLIDPQINKKRTDAVLPHRAGSDHRPHGKGEIAMAEPDSTTLPTPIPTSLNVTALAKRYSDVI
jgi:hypothetical protein